MPNLALRLEIRAEDIEGALFSRQPENQGKLNTTPASVAMGRLTRSVWDTVNPPAGGEVNEDDVPMSLAVPMILIETEAPFRFVPIPHPLREKLHRFCLCGQMEPCAYIVSIEEERPALPYAD